MAYEIPRINDRDEVIGETTIAEAVQNGWPRRIVRVYIFDLAGNFLLQQRSANIIGFPCLWDGAAAGHVDLGEAYETTAYRELAEETGIREVALEPIMVPFHHGINFEAIYRGVVPIGTTITADPHEVTAVKWLSVDLLEASFAREPDIYVPPFLHVWQTFRDKLVR